MGDGNLPTNEFGEIEVQQVFRTDKAGMNILSETDLIEDVFGELINTGQISDIMERAIFAAKNRKVDHYNNLIATRYFLYFFLKFCIYSFLPGEMVTILSEDSVKDNIIEDGIHLPTEYLNTLNNSELPPHELILKKNAIIMLLRNLHVNEGLCNGTRLRVVDIKPYMLNCEILTGYFLKLFNTKF